MRSGFVAIFGRPNVGKSTLLNRLVGQKVAIVTEKPQTTRNRILAVANRKDAQIVYLDTPGIHEPRRELDRLMVDTAVKSLRHVDVVLLVTDVARPLGRISARRSICSWRAEFRDSLRRYGQPAVVYLPRQKTGGLLFHLGVGNQRIRLRLV